MSSLLKTGIAVATSMGKIPLLTVSLGLLQGALSAFMITVIMAIAH